MRPEFSSEEREEIVGLLGLKDRPEEAAAALEKILRHGVDSRAQAEFWSRHIAEHHKAEGWPAPPARPRGRPHSLDAVAECRFLAELYESYTHDKIVSSRLHPFYFLVRRCLGAKDPLKIIQKVLTTRGH